MRSSHSARHRSLDEPATAAGPVEAIVPLVYDRRAAARKASENLEQELIP
jgi:hypothetical protein